MSTKEPKSRLGKTSRACDQCRLKKIRCDGSSKTNHDCSTCILNHLSCTYNKAAPKRGPPKGYVHSLENRLDTLEKILERLQPNNGPSKQSETYSSPLSNVSNASPKPTSVQPIPLALNEDDFASDIDDATEILHNLKLSFDQTEDPAMDTRYFGKSSSAMMIKAAIDFKNDLLGESGRPISSIFSDIMSRRPSIWRIPSWERRIYQRSLTTMTSANGYTFPENDLLALLVECYFKEMNSLYPLLHRPTFQRSLASGLHFRDEDFARLVLGICAAASRLVNDPRALWDKDKPHSAGWSYFEQVHRTPRSLLVPPTLEDIQVYCLSVMFLSGSSSPQACWSIVGTGIRLAQDVGVHRRETYGRKPKAVEELWKRAFWILIVMDRSMSINLGRPCAIQEEDFDLEPLIECDDEYWDHPDPEKAFVQPKGIPSTVSCFVWLIKLQQVQAFALRTIFSINKAKIQLGFIGPSWEQKVMAQIDSTMNQWMSSLPDHLRWDPQRKNDLFFYQSAMVYTVYYTVQIMVHRPFISNRTASPQLTAPSLAICTQAARANSRILEAQERRRKYISGAQIGSAFLSAIVLLLRIWSGKKADVSMDVDKEMEDVYRCMNVLKNCESMYRLAGALWDDLWYLASVNGLPLPASFAFSPRKNASRTIQACFEASDLPFNLSTGRHIHTEADPHNAPVGVSQGLGSIAGTQPPRTTMQATPRPLVGRAATGVSTPSSDPSFDWSSWPTTPFGQNHESESSSSSKDDGVNVLPSPEDWMAVTDEALTVWTEAPMGMSDEWDQWINDMAVDSVEGK